MKPLFINAAMIQDTKAIDRQISILNTLLRSEQNPIKKETLKRTIENLILKSIDLSDNLHSHI